MSKVLTANRVAAIATWLAGLGGLVAGGVGVFPSAWQNGAVAVAGLLTKAAVAVKFLDGSSKWELTYPTFPPLPSEALPPQPAANVDPGPVHVTEALDSEYPEADSDE